MEDNMNYNDGAEIMGLMCESLVGEAKGVQVNAEATVKCEGRKGQSLVQVSHKSIKFSHCQDRQYYRPPD